MQTYIFSLSSAGLAGLALLRAWQLAFVAYEFGAASAHNDALMISVERMLQYIEGVEQEPSHNGKEMDGKR
jgi:hypothetical protein